MRTGEAAYLNPAVRCIDDAYEAGKHFNKSWIIPALCRQANGHPKSVSQELWIW